MTPARMPPLKDVAATLRKTTEYLAREVVRSSESPPIWTPFEWAIARCAAAIQGISALLANNLRWRGDWAWQEFLAEQRTQSVLRDERIGELLRRVDAATQSARIACVGLKGAALRALGLYGPGERPMGDVDLLVSRDDLAGIAVVMRDLGYAEVFTTRRHVSYEPTDKLPTHCFGEHVDNALGIEVHPLVAEPLPVRMVDITSFLRSADQRPGLNPYPSTAALLVHLLLHAAGNMQTHCLRQIQLHDIAAFASRLRDADWGAVFAPPVPAERRWWAFPPLALVARYYPGAVPTDVLRELRGACPRVLRLATDRAALTDVSWSNLHVHALPGIAWSRTPLDALRYVRSRALPSRSSLEGVQFALQVQPHLNQVPWYGMSHGTRIVRWLFSHPPRVQTMVSINAALTSLDHGGPA